MSDPMHNYNNLEKIRDLLTDIVSLIDTNMHKIQGLRYNVSFKADGTPVTEADKLIERTINDYVNSKIPSAVFVGEETYDFEKFDLKSTVAVLDPIDGTENFCSGLKEWGVSFTLWDDGRHLGSLLYMPELGSRLMTGDKLKPIKSKIHGLSTRICDELKEQVDDGQLRIMGCTVYNLYNVIRGSFARFTNPCGAFVWDLLPGIMLALEHNKHVLVNNKIYKGHFLNPEMKYTVDIYSNRQ